MVNPRAGIAHISIYTRKVVRNFEHIPESSEVLVPGVFGDFTAAGGFSDNVAAPAQGTIGLP
ncbi:MAG: hypothetical protein ABIQ81_05620 [Novosphingobium sp.]